MSKKSLASILKLQLWLHTLFTSLFFIAVAFFFLFAMEDYLHEQQLVNLSNILAVNESVKGIPIHIQLYKTSEVPQAWIALLEQVPFNKAIETANQQGHAIHILRSQFSDSEQELVLALDTSKTNSIWAIIDKLLILILPWIIIFLVMASFLAKKFIRQVQSQFNLLLTTINNSGSPEILEQFVQDQPIDEVAQFAQLFIQVWQQKVEILAREKQGLEYLSHELRTPIQSSLATLELLALKTQDTQTIDRLMRSLNRMTRLSNTILYLMESEQLLPTYQVDVMKICQHLVDELTPLANVKKQSISINTIAVNTELTEQLEPLEDERLMQEEMQQENLIEKARAEGTTVNIVATQEVIETLLSILLTNALQHSNSSPIIITISHAHISIKNELKISPQQPFSPEQYADQQGFGIGLTIAQRLAEKFNLSLVILFDEKNQAIATITNQ
jgi:signal transduction histidine kinase